MPSDTPRLVLVSGRHRLSEDALVRCLNTVPGVNARSYRRSEAAEGDDPDIVLVEADSESNAADTRAEVARRFPQARIVLVGAAASRHFPAAPSPSVNAADLLQALLREIPSPTVGSSATRAAPIGSGDAAGLNQLTARQLEVMRLLAAGRRPGEIAVVLSISPQTVRTHLQNMMTTLGVHCRLEIVAAARRSGILDGPRYVAAS